MSTMKVSDNAVSSEEDLLVAAGDGLEETGFGQEDFDVVTQLLCDADVPTLPRCHC